MGKKIKREFIEWAAIIIVFGTLYLTGWHTEVIGQLQRIVVATGIMQPDVLSEDEQLMADYNFTLVDQSGQLVKFDEFKGQTVFMNVWATWCPPCVAEMPDIHDLYEKMENQESVDFVLISLDDDFDKARQFVERKNYRFPIYTLASRLPTVFQNKVVPSTYIISKDGKIVVKRSGMAKYDTEEIRGILLK